MSDADGSRTPIEPSEPAVETAAASSDAAPAATEPHAVAEDADVTADVAAPAADATPDAAPHADGPAESGPSETAEEGEPEAANEPNEQVATEATTDEVEAAAEQPAEAAPASEADPVDGATVQPTESVEAADAAGGPTEAAPEGDEATESSATPADPSGDAGPETANPSGESPGNKAEGESESAVRNESADDDAGDRTVRVRESTGVAPETPRPEEQGSRDDGAPADDLYGDSDAASPRGESAEAEEAAAAERPDPLLSEALPETEADAVRLLEACAREIEAFAEAQRTTQDSHPGSAEAAPPTAAAGAEDENTQPAADEGAAAAKDVDDHAAVAPTQPEEGAEEAPATSPEHSEEPAEDSKGPEAPTEGTAAAPGEEDNAEPAVAEDSESVAESLRRRVAALEEENARLRDRLAATEAPPAKPEKHAKFASPDRANRTSLLLTSPAKLRSPDMRAKARGPQLSPGTVNAVVASVGSPERRGSSRSASVDPAADGSKARTGQLPSRGASRDARPAVATAPAPAPAAPSGTASEAGTCSTGAADGSQPDGGKRVRTASRKDALKGSRDGAAADAGGKDGKTVTKARLDNYNPNARPATLFSKRVLAQTSGASLHNTPPSLRRPLRSADAGGRSGPNSRNVSTSPTRAPVPQPRVKPTEAQRKRSLVRAALAPFHAADQPAPPAN